MGKILSMGRILFMGRILPMGMILPIRRILPWGDLVHGEDHPHGDDPRHGDAGMPIVSMYTMHQCRRAKSAFCFKKVRDVLPKWIRVWVLGDENGARHTHFSSPV